jgi:hypothetical protein
LLDKELKEVSLNERNWPYRKSCVWINWTT